VRRLARQIMRQVLSKHRRPDFSRINLVVDQAGTWLTPPVSSGLLAGTFRDHLLHLGKIQEGRVTLEELRTCRNIFLINSLRGWRRALLVDGL